MRSGELELFGRPLASSLLQRAAGLDVFHDREILRDIRRIMACDEVCLVDVIRAADGRIAEAQMADRHAAGLLGIVLEVRLDVFVRMVADDFDGVLVAPTVPSPPRPQNLHSIVPGAAVFGQLESSGRERPVTSSTMPSVNSRQGSSFSSSVNTAKTDAGGVSFEPSP